MKIVATALLACCTTLAYAQTDPPRRPAPEDFVRPALVVRATPSPSGKRLAMILTLPTGRKVAAVKPLDGPGEPKIVASFENADIDSVAWVNDDRLVYEAAMPGLEILLDGAGTFAVDHDGQRRRDLIAFRNDNSSVGTHVSDRTLTWEWELRGTLDDGSADVLVAWTDRSQHFGRYVGKIARLNTLTGELKSITEGAPDYAGSWILDSQRQLRVVTVRRDGRQRVYWRRPGGDAWTVVLDEPHLGERAVRPLYLENDGTLILEARRPGQDATALMSLDLASGRLDPQPLLAIKGFDIDAVLETDSQTRRVVGAHVRASRGLSVWFDARLDAVQRAVDATLPNRANRIVCGRCESTDHFIVFSSSDRHPGEWFHFDRARRSLNLLGRARPWIDESTQGRRTFHRAPARDGLELPIVVTHPASQPPGPRKPTPLPTVLLVHGGPWLRGADTSWSAEAQFLASRGWRVLEVEFRGSKGFGWRHFSAGIKQWGLGMQDDLADAVQWGAREGLVDPTRVCLVGASYGGYAALMAPIRHPGVFRCAASHAGVTDIELMYSATWGDFSEQTRRYSLPELIGDPKADAALLAAASPVRRVAELKVPVLLAYGGLDRRVPKEHAERFIAAAERAGVKVEAVPYHEEGHGWSLLHNQVDYLKRLEAFLARELGR